MQSERIYLVWAHPRHDSLTAHIADAIHQRAMERKIQVTELDLYRRNFNPVMTPEDEPDWKNMDKRYSPEVHQLYSELLEHDTLVVVFPLWWYSFPAMLKGYIDRVWNNGLAYGDGHKLPFNKVRWVALVGGDKESFVQMGWEKVSAPSVTSCDGCPVWQQSRPSILMDTNDEFSDSKRYHRLSLLFARRITSKIRRAIICPGYRPAVRSQSFHYS
ncbi:NAD(P)H oxidoreductase [Escherichia coli]|jgi:NAD(P)H dehydrogenase (quinone)|nr:NAD(P)H oxidoreductase [Escherichia coli]